MSKLSTPQKSGNSTEDMPIVTMNMGLYTVEIASEDEQSDKALMDAANELRKRNNAYDDMKEALERIVQWSTSRDGSSEADDVALNCIEEIANSAIANAK